MAKKISKRKLYNLGFMPVTDAHVECLTKAGLDIDDSVRDNLLPVINTSEDALSVCFIVRETINSLELSENDVYIISGVPDVGYYVIETLIEKTRGKYIPMILIPLGRHIAGSFKVIGFRQVLIPGVDDKPFHFIQNAYPKK